jgi:hypothetical protein
MEVVASTYRTEDPGFESRQGERCLGLDTLQCCCQNSICIVIVCLREKYNLKVQLKKELTTGKEDDLANLLFTDKRM